MQAGFGAQISKKRGTNPTSKLSQVYIHDMYTNSLEGTKLMRMSDDCNKRTHAHLYVLWW